MATRKKVPTNQASSVHHAASHVLAMTGIALHHHGGRLEDGHGDLGHGELLVVGLLGRDHWSIGGEHEVDPGVRYLGLAEALPRKGKKIPQKIPEKPFRKAISILWKDILKHPKFESTRIPNWSGTP